MSEPHAEPAAADVRSFLPRPGEPVEDYAARLRALHEDLSLVLDAVERGLAAAEAAPAGGPAAAVPLARQAVPAAEDLQEPRRSPPPPGPLSAPRGSARVEVVSTPATASGGGGGDSDWSGPPEPEGAAPGGGRRAPTGGGAPVRGEPAAPSPERWPPTEPWVESAPPPPRSEPWVESRGEPWVESVGGPWAKDAPRADAAPHAEAWAEGGEAPWRRPPPWTERRPSSWPPPPPPPAEMSFGPPAHAPYAGPPRRRAPDLPPVFLAAAVLGWLTVLALVVALAFGL